MECYKNRYVGKSKLLKEDLVRIVEDNLNNMIADIQEAIDVKSGDQASNFFAEEPIEEKVIEVMIEYINFETEQK